MKVTIEELEKALKESGFKPEEKNKSYFRCGSSVISSYILLEVLEKIPEKKEDDGIELVYNEIGTVEDVIIKNKKKEEPKHNWQFVEKHNNDWDGKVYLNTFEFVCPCGATKRVLEKKVEL